MITGAQEYPWFQHYQLRQLEGGDHLDEILAAVRKAGLDAWEPYLPEESSVQMWHELLGKHGLKMPSAYLGGILHEGDAQKTIEEAVARAADANPLGVRVIVCNPNPIAWGSPENKTDDQLRFQAGVLEKICEGLKAQCQRLAYHTHDPEMRRGSRKFTHMMRAIIETAFEDGTPRGLPMEESHGLSREWIESSWTRAVALCTRFKS